MTILYNKISFTLLIVFSSILIYGQNHITRKEMIEELDILKKNLFEIHAGLFDYTPKQEFEFWFDSTKSNLPDSQDIISFYNQITNLSGLIKNGHTIFGCPYDEIRDLRILPLNIDQYDNKYFVRSARNKEDKHLIGKEVIEINGQNMKEVFSSLRNQRARDGYNITYPKKTTEDWFSYFYLIQYGSNDKFQLKINNDPVVTTVNSMKCVDYDSIEEVNYPKYDTYYETISDSIFYFHFHSFAYPDLYNKDFKFDRFLTQMFDSIRKTQSDNLIIDLRHNGGGSEAPAGLLLSYLIKKDIQIEEDAQVITKRISDHHLYKKQGVFWLNNFTWFRFKKRGENDYLIKREDGMRTYKPQDEVYNGKIYILMGGYSFSMSGEFISYIKHHRNNVIFVGEECGGNQYQNTSGNHYTLTLPHSKINCTIPYIKYVMNIPIKNNGHGVQPDLLFESPTKDYIEKKDSLKKYVINLIQHN